MCTREASVSDILKMNGYSHCHGGNELTGQHAVFDSQGGFVGYFTAKNVLGELKL